MSYHHWGGRPALRPKVFAVFDGGRVDAPHLISRSGLKRAMDLVLAGAALLLLAPLMLIVAALVASDGGPVFFRHPRVGRHGRAFGCLKFRTMVPDAEKALEELLQRDPRARAEWARDHKLRKDPRVTRVGRLLRKTSIDELPQFINVVRGEMSLVGPRPIVLDEVKRYGDAIGLYYRCRPGVTGPWQVSGRNDSCYLERIRLDSEYASRISIRRDLKILTKTVKVVLSGAGAY
jgi:lipopolysaccharide/colanic/teichoic acid biosynthesis glycosyltransferase